MRSILILAIASAFAGSLIAAPIPKPAKKNTAEQLIGVWKLTKSDADPKVEYSFTIEFTKDGKLLARYDFGDQNITQTLEGTYKADGDKIEYTLGTRGETLTIDKLTDDDLAVTDPEKKKEEFSRVKEKK